MKQKYNPLALLPLITLFYSCRLQTADEYSIFLSGFLRSGVLEFPLGMLLEGSALLYGISGSLGLILTVTAVGIYFFHKRDKSWIFLALTGLLTAVMYSLPLWVSRVILPTEFWSYPLVNSVMILLWLQSFREWSRKLLYHRTKLWASVANAVLFSLFLIFSLLSGHFPMLTLGGWLIPVLGTLLILDTLMNSFLSFQRKNDRSAVAGTTLLIPLAGTAVWLALSMDYKGLSVFLNHYFFSLPAVMLVWQFILNISMIQHRYAVEIKRSGLLSKMIEDEELQKEKLEKLIDSLEQKIEDINSISDYDLECSRKLLGHEDSPRTKLPEGWVGYQKINALSPDWPSLAVWNENSALLFAESSDERTFIPLLYLAENFKLLRHEKPALLLKNLNQRMSAMGNMMEGNLWGSYFYFLEDEVICGTAGTVRVYLQKSSDNKIIPVRSTDKPVTFQNGLGFRPNSREDGKPFRIKIDEGDRIILVSVSLTDRKNEASGESYGQKSLYRVLNSHTTANPEETVEAIIKDFDDFDMGNTADRQIFAGVYQKD